MLEVLNGANTVCYFPVTCALMKGNIRREKKIRMGDKEGSRVPSLGNKKNTLTTLQTTITQGLLYI